MKRQILGFIFLSSVSNSSFAADATTLVNGTMKDWFNAKSDITRRAAAMISNRYRKGDVSALEIWSCLNEVAIEEKAGSQKVSDVSALCVLTMKSGR